MRADEDRRVTDDTAEHADVRACDTLESVFRRERPQILVVLIRLTGDFALAEDAPQEAFAEALGRWPADGVLPRPAAWITTTAPAHSSMLRGWAAAEGRTWGCFMITRAQVFQREIASSLPSGRSCSARS